MKIWRYIYTTEFYSAVKEIMKLTGKWVELENMILSEVTQTYKDKHHMFFVYTSPSFRILDLYI